MWIVWFLVFLTEFGCHHDGQYQRHPNHRHHHGHPSPGHLCGRNGVGGQSMKQQQQHRFQTTEVFLFSLYSFPSVQAQIFLLIVLITAIINYFIGTFISFESKKAYGFFGYDGTTTSVLHHDPESQSGLFTLNLLLFSQVQSCGKTWVRISMEKLSSRSLPSSFLQPLVSWLEPTSQEIWL